MLYVKFVIVYFILFLLAVNSKAAELDTIYQNAAIEAQIDPELLRAVCFVESSHNNITRILDGSRPSYGPCQIQVPAAKEVGFKGNARLLTRPELSVFFAAKYLKTKLDKYGDWKKAVTAYNRGSFRPGNRVYNSYVIKVLFALKEDR
jgi:hypothetical protein